MKVIILGGDGYLGWPTAMHLSHSSWEVAVVDSYFRRRACHELNVEPLVEVPARLVGFMCPAEKNVYERTSEEEVSPPKEST